MVQQQKKQLEEMMRNMKALYQASVPRSDTCRVPAGKQVSIPCSLMFTKDCQAVSAERLTEYQQRCQGLIIALNGSKINLPFLCPHQAQTSKVNATAFGRQQMRRGLPVRQLSGTISSDQALRRHQSELQQLDSVREKVAPKLFPMMCGTFPK